MIKYNISCCSDKQCGERGKYLSKASFWWNTERMKTTKNIEMILESYKKNQYIKINK